MLCGAVVLTARTKVADRTLIFGERHLRAHWSSTRPTATADDLIEAANSSRLYPVTLSLRPSGCWSSAGRRLTAASTNMSRLRRKPSSTTVAEFSKPTAAGTLE
jgi:hypothetical protein